MDTPIHTELLDKLRAAVDQAMTAATALAHQIVDQQRAVHARYAEEHLRRTDLARVQAPPPRRVASFVGAQDDERRDETWALYERQQAEFAAGRAVIQERAMRDLARQASEAGGDPGAAVDAFARQSPAPDVDGFQRALVSAVAAREAAEAALADLERRRGLVGHRGGLLRQTLHEAEVWLAEQSLAARAAA